MNRIFYEKHTHAHFANQNLPIIFHKDHMIKKSIYEKQCRNSITYHWHENIELLFMLDGSTIIHMDNNVHEAAKGDIAVINSNVLHNIFPKSDYAIYYCLIINKEFCEKNDFFIDEINLKEIIKEEKVFSLIDNIAFEIEQKQKYYSAEILSDVLKILCTLFRKYTSQNSPFNTTDKNIEMVKCAISYINKHITDKLTVDEIANHVGYSKYYFCRCFKEITHSTVIDFINRTKVDYAYSQLSKTNITISEIAVECGFSDISYFTKVFKKYTDVLPSKIRN